LLGRTFIVRTLDDAVALRAKAPAGARFVTPAGEILDEHGAIAFGPRQSATSLVSRRSQLRAARLDLAVLDQQIIDAQRETAHLKREIDRHTQALRVLLEAGKLLDHEAAAAVAAADGLSQRISLALEQKVTVQKALTDAAQACITHEATLKAASEQLRQIQLAADRTQAGISQNEEQLNRLESQRHEAATLATTAKVALARTEQRLESLRTRMTQFEDDSRERERAIDHVRRQLRQAHERREASELAILAASSAIAALVLEKETLSRQMQACAARRNAAANERTTLIDSLNAVRRKALKLRDKEHQLSLAAEQVRHERRTLADRLREDYRIELADLTDEPSPAEAQERAAVEDPPHVGLEPARLVTLAVHDGNAQAGGRKPSRAPRRREHVLAGALPHPVLPVAAVAMAERRVRHQRTVVILFACGHREAGAAEGGGADQIHLSRADQDVVADAAVECFHDAFGIGALERGEVHRGIEVAAGQRGEELLLRAVRPEARHAAAEGIRVRAAIQQRDLVPGGDEPPGELVAHEPGAADHEDAQV